MLRESIHARRFSGGLSERRRQDKNTVPVSAERQPVVNDLTVTLPADPSVPIFPLSMVRPASKTYPATSILRAALHITQTHEVSLVPVQLCLVQFTILSVLKSCAGDPPSIARLAAKLATNRATAGAAIRVLEQKGLVRLRVNAAGVRGQRMTLTKAGVTKLRQARRLWRDAQFCWQAALDTQTVSDLQLSLELIASLNIHLPIS